MKLNHFYRFGVIEFVSFFKETIKTLSDPRGNNITKHILNRFITAYAPSMDQDDYFTFLLHIHYGLKPEQWSGLYWDFFIESSRFLSNSSSDELPYWAEKGTLQSFSLLRKTCPSIVEGMDLNTPDWKDWSVSGNCYKSFPKCSLTQVERLLFIKALRPDNLSISAASFCCSNFGLDVICSSPPQYTMSEIWELRCSQSSPIMFVTSEDNDPTRDIEMLSKKVLGSEW